MGTPILDTDTLDELAGLDDLPDDLQAYTDDEEESFDDAAKVVEAQPWNRTLWN